MGRSRTVGRCRAGRRLARIRPSSHGPGASTVLAVEQPEVVIRDVAAAGTASVMPTTAGWCSWMAPCRGTPWRSRSPRTSRGCSGRRRPRPGSRPRSGRTAVPARRRRLRWLRLAARTGRSAAALKQRIVEEALRRIGRIEHRGRHGCCAPVCRVPHDGALPRGRRPSRVPGRAQPRRRCRSTTASWPIPGSTT